ncbi:MAG TPA: tRNA pseudouridine(38-40) synthase TruA [Actinomycetota bacterium]|nr:tRNA pseudouridine(38-40) synthase TruA [Actinomycetota bacterium]
MTRTIRMTVAYDGTGFHGWAAQRDPQLRTVAGVLHDHLERILGDRPRLTVAGRTDAGVHARGNVISFPVQGRVTAVRLARALNAALAPEVVVRDAAEVASTFSARFSATAREYAYRIDTAPVPDPFTARFVWHRPGDLHLPSMRAAARTLAGEHDFASFCRHPGAGRSTVRRLERATVRRDGDLFALGFRADAFLHQMVRSLVAAIVGVGRGAATIDELARILAAADRHASKGRLAPPRGLTLERVVYGRRPEGRPATSGRR